jgi:hypothetical protein
MKIEIKIEGEDIDEFIKEIEGLLESNKDHIKKVLKLLAKETIDVMEDSHVLDKGADLYIKINRAINYKYREKSKKKK